MTEEKKKAGAKKAPKAVDKAALKQKLRTLKKERTEALGAKDAKKTERIRASYRRTTRKLRKLAPPKGKKVKAE